VKKITLKLDIERPIRFNVNAMTEIERLFDAPIQVLFKADKVGFGFIRDLTWVALKYGGMKFNVKMGRSKEEHMEFVGDLIQDHWLEEGKALDELMEILMDAFKESGLLPKEAFDDEEGADEDPQKGDKVE
jgi:hypothetical protein